MSDETNTNSVVLTGLDALGYAVLRDLTHVFLDGCLVSIEAAREASYDRLDAVSVRATFGARGWMPGATRRWENNASAPRVQRATPDTRRYASSEEYIVAAAMAVRERALWDAENARLVGAKFREGHIPGNWLRERKVYSRAEALAFVERAAKGSEPTAAPVPVVATGEAVHDIFFAPSGLSAAQLAAFAATTRADAERERVAATAPRAAADADASRVDLDALRAFLAHVAREAPIIRHAVQLGQADRSLALLDAMPALLDELAEARRRIVAYEAKNAIRYVEDMEGVTR